MKLCSLLEDQLALLEVRPITEKERRLVRKAQELAKTLHQAIQAKPKGYNEPPLSVAEVQELYDQLARYASEFSFLEPTVAHLKALLGAHQKMSSHQEVVAANLDHLKHHTRELTKAFLGVDLVKGRLHHHELTKTLAEVDHHADVGASAQQHLTSRYTNKPSIFGSVGLLTPLHEAEYRKIEAIKPDDKLYTFVDFPVEKLASDWHYIAYFLLHLQASPSPVQLDNPAEFRRYIKVKHANDGNMAKLLKLVDRYLHHNDKKLIPEILGLIELLPTIKQANERRKQEITKVYRGLGFGEEDVPSTDEILAEERRLRYVATSTSRRTATNFAYQIGHLEAQDARRSGAGYLLTYQVHPGAILFDTQVIDTAYLETEVLIDTAKAKLLGIEDL